MNRKSLSLLIAAAILSCLFTNYLFGQSNEGPLRVADVIQAVELGVSKEALIKQIELRGVCFRMNDAQSDRLREMDIPDSVLLALVKAKYTSPVNPWLGVHLKNQPNGVIARFVYPDSPAQAAGIRFGDRIVSINGQSVQDVEVLVALVQAGRIGETNSIELIRDTESLKLDAKFVQQPEDESMHNSVLSCAEQGDVEAQVILATNFYFGSGVEKNIPESVVWTKKAAEVGSADAQTTFADFLMNGIGIEKNQAQAVSWFRKAAEQNHPIAQRQMARLLISGDGVTRDIAEARKFALLSAGQSDAVACLILGWMSETGEGTSVDRDQAIKWYRLAAKQGNEISVKALERLGADKKP